MSGIENFEFNSFLIQRFMPSNQGFSIAGKESKPNHGVYHYTSPDAFLSIIENQEIRFTDIRYLNDRAEGVYFVKLLFDFLDKNVGQYPYFEEVVNQLLKENDRDKIQKLEVIEVNYNEIPRMPYRADRVFVFCACTGSDLLNMWNYYVNNGAYQGYNIGLRLKELLKTFDTPNKNTVDAFRVYYGNVIYDLKSQMNEITMLADSMEKKIKVSPDPEKSIKLAQIELRSYINTQGAFYKHPKFKAENEFRIILAIAESRIPHTKKEAEKFAGLNNKQLIEGFCIKRGLIVPYSAVSLPENAISRITVAPMIEFDIAKLSIQELFDIKGLGRPPIHKSNIPIRF